MISQYTIDRKRVKRMREVDALPSEIRALVHEYGLNLVRAFLEIGVTKPNHIKHLVETVLNEMVPTRGSSSAQGPRRGELVHRQTGDTTNGDTCVGLAQPAGAPRS